MSPQQFIDQWPDDSEHFQKYSEETLKLFGLNDNSIEFLHKAGLPKSCAPYLGFYDDFNPTVEFVGIDTLDKMYELEEIFRKYLVIGSDGAGNPIAINTSASCIIQCLDYENDFSEEFMNSSVSHLGNCLLVYRIFVKKTLEVYGEDGLMDCKFNDEEYQKLVTDLKIADERAVSEGFWKGELELLLINREYYRTH